MDQPIRRRPRVDVLMPVRDGERFLNRAVESVVKQTYSGWRLIVIDDGSVDATPQILAGWDHADARIVVRRNSSSRGIGYSLRRAVLLSDAPILARLDADDISHRERLADQVEYFIRDPKLILLGSYARRVTETGQQLGFVTLPVAHDEIVKHLLRDNPFIHSSVMFRRTAYDEAGGYREALCEDYHLWLSMAPLGKLANVPRALVDFRVHSAADSAFRRPQYRRERLRCQLRAARELGPVRKAVFPIIRTGGAIAISSFTKAE